MLFLLYNQEGTRGILGSFGLMADFLLPPPGWQAFAEPD
jgi:hypothetical protein